METQQDIERHNRRSLYEEATMRLRAAEHELGLVKGILDDLDDPEIPEGLQQLGPHIAALRQLAAQTDERMTR